jgi:aromatic-L-amino-acid/L-tryptophan decarboxylase
VWSHRYGVTLTWMSIPLEPDKQQRDELSEAVLSYLDGWYQHAAEMPAFGTDIDPELIGLLGRPPAEDGRSIHSILQDLDAAGQSGMYHPSGGHMSYIPNAGLYSGALADLLGSGLNRYTGVTGAAPGMTAIEHGVVRWMLSLFDFGPEASGVLLSGGSTANFTGMVAARAARLGEDIQNAVVYVTGGTHHSAAKAARLAGIGDTRIRSVAADADLRMSPGALADAVTEDRNAGLEPFLVVGSAGTTDTGTVDPLDALADVAEQEGLWYHIDAAYGGFFVLTDRGKRTLEGINRADSLTLDPHKGLSIPFGVGALLVREEADLIDAHQGRGAYLVEDDVYMGLRDISSLGLELSRPNRGLLVWLPLQLHGLAPFREALDTSLDLAQVAYQRLSGIEGIETPWPPDLSIVAFRFEDDAMGRAALEAIKQDRRVHLSPTTIDGRFVLRFAILNRRSTEDHVHHAIDIIEKTLIG